MFKSHGDRQIDLNIHIPKVNLHCQKQCFAYQSIILWNRCYKKLIAPFTITLHQEHTKKHKLTSCESVHYDFSTKVSLFKSNLSKLLHSRQSSGEQITWFDYNYNYMCSGLNSVHLH